MIPIVYCNDLGYDGNLDLPTLKKSQAFAYSPEALNHGQMFKPPKIMTKDLARAHDPDFLHHVLYEPMEHNGIQMVEDEETGQLLVQRALWAVSCMVFAAELALEKQVACAPVSGFHHAGWDFHSGYCTFNGLMVAITKLLAEGKVKKVAIIDLDTHFGDGTQSIIKELRLQENVMHLTHGRTHSFATFSRSSDQTLRALNNYLPGLLEQFKPDLVLYQAGADMHIDDPLGAGYMTRFQLIARDTAVFRACKKAKVPVAWCLAGGYQDLKTVVDLHINTLLQCVDVFVTIPGLKVPAPSASVETPQPESTSLDKGA